MPPADDDDLDPPSFDPTPVKILLPRNNDNLGVRFSVFGTCTAIGPNGNGTITVVLKNFATPVATATGSDVKYNRPKGTFEAIFNLGQETVIPDKLGSIVATLDGKTDYDTVISLTIQSQGGVVLTAPLPQTQFNAWSARSLIASAIVSGYNGKTCYVRLTDGGYDLHNNPDAAYAMTIDADPWYMNLNLNSIVNDPPTATSSNIDITVSVYDGNSEYVRVSSGFFTVNV